VQLPPQLLNSISNTTGFNKKAFEKVHTSGEQVTSVRINPLKIPEASQIPSLNENVEEPISWSQYGYYLKTRPSFTFDPLFHAGCYYVQEASSMFLEQALKQTTDLLQPLKILDLSAAPGGKSTHIQSLISKDSLLVSNDVIRSRANILKDNIIKWGSENVIVTNNDPHDFGKLKSFFDVIVIDAPCSGSGLFRREPEAADEWSLNSVALCSQRQQRILVDVMPALKKDGILIYSTCSYSKEEDEDIVDWLTNELPVVSCQLSVDNFPGIIPSGGGYRFWPDKIKGEGFFIACFKKTDGEEKSSLKIKTTVEFAAKKEVSIIEKWVKSSHHRFIKHENTVYAWPENAVNDMNVILFNLRVIYSGIRVGELIRDKLLPDHALAMSKLISDSIPGLNVNYEQAIQYLQRKEIAIKAGQTGWQLINYERHPLGWVNVLPNRINNYYPKEFRILKDS
jgi:16S rRNA C967 or C1407 C5-methylase (RsmB/RsmF family)/NOL1/NOP2/fmu family ribosome biogenesis protein